MGVRATPGNRLRGARNVAGGGLGADASDPEARPPRPAERAGRWCPEEARAGSDAKRLSDRTPPPPLFLMLSKLGVWISSPAADIRLRARGPIGTGAHPSRHAQAHRNWARARETRAVRAAERTAASETGRPGVWARSGLCRRRATRSEGPAVADGVCARAPAAALTNASVYGGGCRRRRCSRRASHAPRLRRGKPRAWFGKR